MKLLQQAHRIYNELYLMLNSHCRAVRWLRFMISERTLWLSIDQKIEFWSREADASSSWTTWRLIRASGGVYPLRLFRTLKQAQRYSNTAQCPQYGRGMFTTADDGDIFIWPYRDPVKIVSVV